MVVRDRRRIDPDTGAVRTPADGGEGGTGSDGGGVTLPPSAGPAAPGAPDGTDGAGALEELQARLDERTNDLQRITAEYANYRKRVDRDRELVVTSAKAQVVADLLGVLDDLERAEAHGDLTGAFRAVGDKVTTALQKAGLVAFGHEGEAFDPSLHEAVQHDTSPDVPGPTVTAVLRRGYTFGERVLRPAMVAVTDHEPGAVPVGEPLVEPEPAGGLAPQDGQGDTAGDR
ncbi:MAG TPA: nucleotide exchange factor GrpE [Pseudonocardiaceae bacterium]